MCVVVVSDNGAFVCQLQRGPDFKVQDVAKPEDYGLGFLTEMEPRPRDEFEMVVLERATVMCEDVHAKCFSFNIS